LLEALRSSVSKIAPDGRRVEDALVDALIAEAFHGRNKLAALSYIFDRLEGRPRQQASPFLKPDLSASRKIPIERFSPSDSIARPVEAGWHFSPP